MQMIQLQNYRQWDVSLPADLWLFLGKSSKPPLLLSPPLEIIREYSSFFFFFLVFRYEYILLPPSPARRERSRSSGDGCPAPWGRGHWPVARGTHMPGKANTTPLAFPICREDLHRLAPGLGRRRAAAAAIFSLVFLDINTSSLHPQDGFQASILFPMATKTQPGNLNPLTPLSRRRGWCGGGGPGPPVWSFQLNIKLF